LNLTAPEKLNNLENSLKSSKRTLKEVTNNLNEIEKEIKIHQDWLDSTKPPIQYLDHIDDVIFSNIGKSIKNSSTLDPKIEQEIREYIKAHDHHRLSISHLEKTRSALIRKGGILRRDIETAEIDIHTIKIEMLPELKKFLEKRKQKYESRLKREQENG